MFIITNIKKGNEIFIVRSPLKSLIQKKKNLSVINAGGQGYTIQNPVNSAIAMTQNPDQ